MRKVCLHRCNFVLSCHPYFAWLRTIESDAVCLTLRRFQPFLRGWNTATCALPPLAQLYGANRRAPSSIASILRSGARSLRFAGFYDRDVRGHCPALTRQSRASRNAYRDVQVLEVLTQRAYAAPISSRRWRGEAPQWVRTACDSALASE